MDAIEEMEDREDKNIFDSLNLNPQLFINEVLNTVDDIVDEGFNFFEEQGLERIGGKSEEEDNQLRKGVSSIRYMIQEGLNSRLGMWEKYCLRHCFSVPEGLALPKANTSGDGLMEVDAPTALELDNELESLREKLSAAQKESNELERELHAMKKQSITNSCIESVRDASKQLEQPSIQEKFHELVKAAASLRAKMEKLESKRKAEMERSRTDEIYGLSKEQISRCYISGLSDNDLCELQEHLTDLQN